MIYLLHISDLHLVADPHWNNMKNAILTSVKDRLSSVPRGQKLLIITGDFHNFFQHNYDQALQYLPQLFEAMDIEPDKDVFVIPGNHDVANSSASDPEDRDIYIQAIRTKPEMLHTRVEKLLSHYDNYISFTQAIRVYSSDCGTLPVSVHARTWRNKLHILHLNTTLIADGAKDNQMMDILTATSDDIRKQLRQGALPCIAIGHNSFFDLNYDQQISLSALFLQENISAYLCGDRRQKNTIRSENRIELKDGFHSATIPNIVSYRSSTDELDTYSDFGMIWQIWEEETGHVDLEFLKWDSKDQGELMPDGADSYSFREPSSFISAAPVKTNSDSSWLSNEELQKKSSHPFKNHHIRRFLRGGHCEWNVAFSDKIVTRDIVEELYKKSQNSGIYALSGPGGEGKSTILKQLCKKLMDNHIPVFYYRRYGPLTLPDTIPESAVFLLDNPPDTMKFKNLLDKIIEQEQTLILGVRQNEWNLLKKSLKISSRDVSDIPIPNLTVKESWRFAECVCTYLHSPKEKREIKELFQHNSYGFLYAAMLMIVKERNSLEEIAEEIIENLQERSPKSLLLLAHIVLSEHCSVRFTRIQWRDICSKLSLIPKDATGALSREVTLNGELYQTRHEIISELFFRELFSDEGLLLPEQIDDILTNLMEYQLKRYQTAYTPRIRDISWHSVLKLSQSLW